MFNLPTIAENNVNFAKATLANNTGGDTARQFAMELCENGKWDMFLLFATADDPTVSNDAKKALERWEQLENDLFPVVELHTTDYGQVYWV